MKKTLALLLAVLMVVSLFAGCAAKQEPAQTEEPAADTQQTGEPAAAEEPAAEEVTEEPVEEPKELSGEVNVYIASSEDFALACKESFEADYPGVTLNYVLLGGGEILTRLRAEKENPQADALRGGSVDLYMNASKDGLLMPYVPDFVRETFDPACIPADESYVIGLKSILGICYDKDWYDANGVAYPETWDDLLIPELEGNVIITNPGTSTTGYMMMSSLIALRGEEAGMQYMVDLNKNIKSYAKGGSGPVNSVSLGECAAGMCYLHFGIQLQEQGYTNIGLCVPTEGTGVEECCSAVINNCKNPENGKAFQDWYLSKGLALYEQFGYYNYPCNPEVHVNETAEQYLPLLKDAGIDYQWAADNYDRLVEEWDAKISNN